ncbi:hypothetical protein D0869_11382 [Hortaea werneckii]|uniref:NTF2-like domain-containing protein n=1 Tax=Hortaea werneckii TaxID=91943 RepID=A0A3M7B482_HORWE|nr:hypothetical protein KC334_g3952 [Hortaea werneckii]KAI7019185.1 hypothetical protein KC355_g3123 [Hortaea werneckii]KAI7172152.1 hypothetical protein KC324_g10795 [Hortaea werneckii]KAI7585722.1 hypothetical protein KC316_g6014 [Hortaea werneckii]KAI7671044.1 hypothetical protein KC318_g3723 [Hortaea werneckii]
MHLTTIFSAVSITSGVLAVPLQTCLTPEQASCIVEQYIGIADGTGYDNQSANATAQALISDDFTGDSGSFSRCKNLDDLYATSKAQFISDVLDYGPWPDIHTNDIIFGCNKIVWYWTFPYVGTGQYEVKGFNLFEINSQYQICKTCIEFNSIAWGLDSNQGLLCPTNSTN